MGNEKQAALASVVQHINQRFGSGAIMRMTQAGQNIPVIQTGSIGLDLALGVGGVPRGRVTEIFGPESSGKTTLAQHIIAQAQAAGGTAAFIDAEHAFDASYAAQCGVQVNHLLVAQPDYGEQALEIAETLIRSGGVDVVVIDSVAALVPRAEIEGDMGDSLPGLHARLMSQALRKLSGCIASTNTTLVFLNQLRHKIGVMHHAEVTTGGQALKYYASVRLDIRTVKIHRDGDEPVGRRARVKVVKNKVAPPFQQAEFDIMVGEGIAHHSDLLDVAIQCGIVQSQGRSFHLGDTRLGRCREEVYEFFMDRPGISREIETICRMQQASAVAAGA
jgi:recombination protein RecA